MSLFVYSLPLIVSESVLHAEGEDLGRRSFVEALKDSKTVVSSSVLFLLIHANEARRFSRAKRRVLPSSTAGLSCFKSKCYDLVVITEGSGREGRRESQRGVGVRIERGAGPARKRELRDEEEVGEV